MQKSGTLRPFGLDKKTEQAYRALLNATDAPASQVARKAGIKRTSVYHILENLISMGLASSYIEKGARRFVAEHPSKLKSFFERQAILADRILPDLEAEMKKMHSGAAIRVFEGKEAIRGMNEEALHAKDKLVLSIGSTYDLLKFLGGKFGFGKRRRERRIFMRALRFPQDEARGLASSFQDVRFLPASFHFPGYVFIFDNSVGVVTFESPGRGVLVTDAAYAQMMRSVFETLWQMGSKPPKK